MIPPGSAAWWRREYSTLFDACEKDRLDLLRVLQPAVHEGRNFMPDATDDQAAAIEALALHLLAVMETGCCDEHPPASLRTGT